MQFATWLFMLAFAYGIGIFWYDLLPGRLPHMTWHVAAYPFLLMVIGEALVPFGAIVYGVPCLHRHYRWPDRCRD